MKSFVLAVVSVAILFAGATSAEAQHYHRYTYRPYQPLTTGHYHDRAGHMVDSYGHHVDSYGHHTGGVGLSIDAFALPDHLAVRTSVRFDVPGVVGFW